MKVQESFNDYQFKVKCNDQPEILVNVVAETEDKAKEYAKDMYAKQHTTYADDRKNKWSISRTNNPAEGNTIYEDGNVAKHIQDKINSAVDASTIIPNEVKSELKSIIISKSGKTRSGNRWYGQKLPVAVLKKYYPHYDYVSYNDAFRNDQFNGEGGSTFTDLVDAIYDAMKDKWNLTNKNESYDNSKSGVLDYIADAKDYVNAGNISSAIDALNSAVKILSGLDESFDADRVQKRIASVDEFNNGNVINNDYFNASSSEAEEIARQASLKDPSKIFYVKYDDVMNPSSDIKWKNGEKVDHLGKKLTNESIIRYPNGMEVTDVDLDRALDYQYGTDRDMDNSKYTDDEKQRAVTYWIKKTDPSPYDEAKVPNDKGELTALKTKLVEVGTKLRTKNGHLITIENISASFDLDGKGKPFFDYSFEKADGTTGKSHCDDYSLNRMFYGMDESIDEAKKARFTKTEVYDKLKARLDEIVKEKGLSNDEDIIGIQMDPFEGKEYVGGKEVPAHGTKYTVYGELGYSTFESIADELDKVFKDNGIDAYFEGEVPGRWVAVVWNDDVSESVKLMSQADRMIEQLRSVTDEVGQTQNESKPDVIDEVDKALDEVTKDVESVDDKVTPPDEFAESWRTPKSSK